jgi:hypothetical protein
MIKLSKTSMVLVIQMLSSSNAKQVMNSKLIAVSPTGSET